MTCSRPLYEVLSNAINNTDALFDWLFCPYTITGLGFAGVGLIVLATGFVGIKNWSESWELPLVWLAIVGPVLATAMLPGGVIRMIAGVMTLAVAIIFIGWYYWSGRA